MILRETKRNRLTNHFKVTRFNIDISSMQLLFVGGTKLKRSSLADHREGGQVVTVAGGRLHGTRGAIPVHRAAQRLLEAE